MEKLNNVLSDLNDDVFFEKTIKSKNTYVDYNKNNVKCLITALYRFDRDTDKPLINRFGDKIVKVRLVTDEGHVHYEEFNTEVITFNDKKIPPYGLRNLILAVGIYVAQGEGEDCRKIIPEGWENNLVGHEVMIDFELKRGWAKIKNVRPFCRVNSSVDVQGGSSPTKEIGF